MILNRTTPCQFFSIKKPRWHDRVVLLATYKVGTHNEIVFSQEPSLPDHYYINGYDAKQYPISNNGVLDCYAVKLDDLELLERI